MNFSLVLASRQRSQLLVGFLRSLEENTDDLSNIEVIVGIDDDDPESHDAARHCSGWFPWVKFFSRQRSNWMNRDYLNYGYATHGSGRFAIGCNDDILVKTKSWDRIAMDKLENYLSDKKDRIVYAFLSD